MHMGTVFLASALIAAGLLVYLFFMLFRGDSL